MAGGLSQFESFDFKPELGKMDTQPFPELFTKGQQLAQLQNMKLETMGPLVDFKKCGQSAAPRCRKAATDAITTSSASRFSWRGRRESRDDF